MLERKRMEPAVLCKIASSTYYSLCISANCAVWSDLLIVVLLALSIVTCFDMRKFLQSWLLSWGGVGSLYWNLCLNWTTHLVVQRLVSALNQMSLMKTRFLPTRLETRTKESNIYASSRHQCLLDEMKMISGIFAPETNQAPVWGLSMSISVRTRKMVNYACQG